VRVDRFGVLSEMFLRGLEEESSARWECGKRVAFSKGGGPLWETERSAQSLSDGGFPQRSTARHFHSAPGSLEAASGAELGDACQQLALGALHVERGFGIGLPLGEALQFGQGDAGAEQVPAVWHLLE
jgi:hypothetical protein